MTNVSLEILNSVMTFLETVSAWFILFLLLASRVQALLRAMRSQEQKLHSNAPKQLKRKSPDTNPSSKKSSKARVPPSPSKEVPIDDAKVSLIFSRIISNLTVNLKVSNWCLATMKESKAVVKALKKLKSLYQDVGLSSDPKAVVKYVFKVGDFITRTGSQPPSCRAPILIMNVLGNENRCNFATPEEVERHLWTLSAPFVRSTAERLSALYWDLAAEPNATSKQESILRRFDDETRNR